MDVYAYTQTCIQLQSDFLSGRVNACACGSSCKWMCILVLERQDKDYPADDDDDVVMIDFYVADKR